MKHLYFQGFLILSHTKKVQIFITPPIRPFPRYRLLHTLHILKAVNREDKRSRRYRDRDFAKFERSRRYRDR
jgi:hypothetical protein